MIVGHSDGYAFRYASGTMQRLIDLIPAGTGWHQLYQANDINNAGQILGYGCHTSGCLPFLFTPAIGATPATIVPIGAANQSVSPRKLNAAGQVAGSIYDTTLNKYKAFLFTPGGGGGTFEVIEGFGGRYTFAEDLNDIGQVVGYSHLPGDSVYHAFLHANGQTVDLAVGQNTTSSQAYAINDNGIIIGYSNGYFVRSTDGVMRQISNLISGCNWSFQWLNGAINNTGQMAGYAYENGVGYKAFVMTPVVGQAQSTMVANDRSGAYRGPIQLTARLTAACSALYGKTVTFSR